MRRTKIKNSSARQHSLSFLSLPAAAHTSRTQSIPILANLPQSVSLSLFLKMSTFSTIITILLLIPIVFVLVYLFLSHHRLPRSGPLSSVTAAPPHHQLRILTQNLWLHYLVIAPHRSYRVQKFVENVARHDFDIVAVQEAFLLRVGPFVLSDHVKQLIEGMRDIGYHYWTDPTASLPQLIGQNSGLIVFSRLPFAAQSSDVFTHSDEITNNKGFVGVQFNFATSTSSSNSSNDNDSNTNLHLGYNSSQNLDHRSIRTMHLYCTHLDSRLQSTKEKQVAELAARLQSFDLTNTAIVALGDFNICQRSYGTLTARGRSHYYEELITTLRGRYELVNAFDSDDYVTHRDKMPRGSMVLYAVTFGLLGPALPTSMPTRGLALDHLFFNPSVLRLLQREILNWSSESIPVSDHLGCCATLELL